MTKNPWVAPPKSQLFEPTRDSYGVRLAWVFGNEAPGGECPFVIANRCHHCDIGLGEGREFVSSDNLSRVAWLQSHYADVLPLVGHLVIYNSGSTLNPRELSPKTLAGIVDSVAGLPRLHALSLDTREMFLTSQRLEMLAAALPTSVIVRPILGVESIDDHIRNELLQKAMSRRAILRGLDEVAAASSADPGRIGLEANILVGGPGASGAAATADARATAAWLLLECDRRSLSLDLNLHPYYPSQRGLQRFPDHPRCTWPQLCKATAAILEAIAAFSPSHPGLSPPRLFIGWQDEGHDQAPASRLSQRGDWKQALQEFNRTQLVEDLILGSREK